MTSKEPRENPFQLKNPNAKNEPSFFNTNRVSINPAALREVLDYVNSILALCES